MKKIVCLISSSLCKNKDKCKISINQQANRSLSQNRNLRENRNNKKAS